MSFPYKNAQDLRSHANELGIDLPWSDDLQILGNTVKGANFSLPNALCAQPMEGNDADANGAPSLVTLRRYQKLAAGGSGLIWVEAVAISKEARANPHQLMITKENMPMYRQLMESILAAASDRGLPRPLVIVQLTHSGRNTSGTRITASAHPVMNPHQNLAMDYPIVSDEQLLCIQNEFAQASMLLREAGFNGVDIKCCHLYLLSELLGATNRPGSYGGLWQGRSRMQTETTAAIIKACGRDWVYASRLNACDAMAGGFCTEENLEPKFDEAIDLCRMMWEQGVTLFNITMGTPYYNPHINRPYAGHPRGEGYDPPEDPLLGVVRLLSGCAAIQSALPTSVCVATGFSYLRRFAPHVGAGMLHRGTATSLGFGREWLAYPDYAIDAMQGGMRAEKCCFTCGLCTYLMRRGQAVGCPVRDKEYFPLLREAQQMGR